MTQKKVPQKPLVINIPDDLEAIYANIARITHSPGEMVLDFARFLPGTQPAHVVSRLIMNPLSVKLLQRALAENLAKYESKFGEIKIPGNSSLADYLFKPSEG